MDAKKALYRAKLKESAQKRDKRIESPLVRYNECDQPICRVCDVVLKSESLWAAHQASRKHHEAIAKFKANASGQARNSANTEPPKELVHRTRPASALPADFFDKNETKKQKTGMGSGGKIESDTNKGSVKSMNSLSSEEAIASNSQLNEQYSVDALTVKGKRESTPFKHPSQTTKKSTNSGVGGALPEGFFDNNVVEETRKMGVSEVKQVKGVLPEGFFDNKDAETTGDMDGSEIKQASGSLPEGFFDKEDANTNKLPIGSEVKQVKGALPEGFFDNKDADLRARGIQPVKVDIKDEYKEFEKLIQEDLQEVDERYGEEEIDAAEVREEEETLEQKAYRERVEMLKKKQLELKAARFNQKSSKLGKDSSDEDSSSDDESDDDDGNFNVDWRAKHL